MVLGRNLVCCSCCAPNEILLKMSIQWFLIFWHRETIVFHDLVVVVSRVLGCAWSVRVVEIYMVQSKPNSVPMKPLKGIHERCCNKPFQLHTIQIVSYTNESQRK